jgi:tRNA A-37 threonylcarbamoyl transferase component Bud32
MQTQTALAGRWLLLARALWFAVAVVSISVFLAAVPARVALLLQPGDAIAQMLTQASLSTSAYAILIAAREITFVLAFAGIGIFIFVRRSDVGPAIFTSAVMIAFASSFFAVYRLVYLDFSPALYTLARVVLMIGFGGAPILIYTFPDGYFVPRWMRFAAIAWIAVIVLQFPTHEGLFTYINGERRVLPTTLLMYGAFLVLAIYAQVYRYWHYSDSAGRLQTKWVLLGFASGIVALLVWYTSLLLFPLARDDATIRMLRLLIGETLYLIGFIAIPLSIAFSILRYRLYDINLFLSRGLVYGTLTLILAVVFFLSLIVLKSALEWVLGGPQNTLAAVVSTAIVVGLFQPTRARLQRAIEIRFFRGRAASVTQVASAAPNPGLHSGKVLGQYVLDAVIGRGGMGEVYHAVHTGLRRETAVKVLHGERADADELRVRFEREARAIASIRHPNIVAVYDYGEADGLLYMAMEYLDGQLLSRRLTGQPMSLDAALPILREVAAAIDFAHARGMIHRDVKPSNIMLTPPVDGVPGRAVLMDFGIAKLADAASHITHTGMLGTVDYIAPEQIMNAGDVTPKADLYAFGVIAYQMLTGVLPFTGSSPGQVLYAHLQQTAEDPRSRVSTLSPSAAATLMKALSKTPNDRPDSAAAILRGLEGSVSVNTVV